MSESYPVTGKLPYLRGAGGLNSLGQEAGHFSTLHRPVEFF